MTATPDVTTSKFPPTAHARIGNHLRRMYDDLADEPVPDKFLEILADLESKEKK